MYCLPIASFEMHRIPSSLLPIHAPTYGNLITVLSIDGGGIRGIIPATILAFLETQLQVFVESCIRIYEPYPCYVRVGIYA